MCPLVLNDASLTQSALDSNKRYRQHVLAMAKRWLTNNFHHRFFCTQLGISFMRADAAR